MIKIKLDAYLARLRADELAKPTAQQRPIPSFAELAEEVGISPVTMSRIVNGHIKQMNLETADALIKAMRRRGFEMDVSDLLAFEFD